MLVKRFDLKRTTVRRCERTKGNRYLDINEEYGNSLVAMFVAEYQRLISLKKRESINFGGLSLGIGLNWV